MSEQQRKLPYGIVGVDLGEVERSVPATEPPAWPPNQDLDVVGKPTPRLDGRAKVTGAARYTADVRLPGMLWAVVIPAPVPHGTVRRIDVRAASRSPGVQAVHLLEQVYGSAKLVDPDSERKSKFPVIRYAGQPLGAIAATSLDAARDALAKVRIDVTELPFVVDERVAQAEGAPRVFPGAANQSGSAGGGGGPAGVPQEGNVRGPKSEVRGDVQEGLREADAIVRATFRTQVQTHSCLETHGVVADYTPDGLTVYASTQGTHTVQEELAHVFDLPVSKVRVVTEYMGGGFGSKFGAGNAGVLAVHLSKKAGAPVHLMYDRKLEHLSAGNRPSSTMELTVGAKKDGTLTAIRHISRGTAGTGTGSATSAPARNMYPCPNLTTEDYDVFTHAGPSTAFRAPGHPQGCFALEQAMDELAEKLGMDPIALRDRIDVDGDHFIDSDARRRERKIGTERIGWSRRTAPGTGEGPKKRGIGMAQSIWYRIVDGAASAEVRIAPDGTVSVLSAVQDIGTGIRTALAQVVAEELGLEASRVQVRIGDTDHVTGVASGGSKTTGSITPAARNAAFRAARELAAAAARDTDVPAERLVFSKGRVHDREDPKRSLRFEDAARKLDAEIRVTARRTPDYEGFEFGGEGGSGLGVGGLGGVQFVEVEVDTETGIIRVERVVAVQDCGRPVNPLALESQINGGIIQGISYALFEDRKMDRRTGYMVHPNLDQYKILGSVDCPVIEPVVIEQYHGRSSTDVAGIGEPATIPTCAAVANAVYNAIGVRIRELPMTPAVVLGALGKLPDDRRSS